ncbi:hypothetical protein CONPUDRAFT_154193 [Coniophora puteana RWD-64-598 SS2]|uniref:DUF6533 domain-containing protein n=1 Tax=Coniophora puteana (strain RWD-64-598) TaxID=741705 RepID=A0A5M3MM06_CONPW|nr:uncharacterized protein CONPUDRAFT_154193 [Coniophora puteana RWD-64-598 SS2]EIW80143.1 hypothetical protein CONPUDRAFT_154193 [Coniophora puteana RWD-64-598 SS2]
MSELWPSNYISTEVGQQTAKYTNSALGLLVYDYFLTLPGEAYWIWGKPWDLVRVLFTLSRYLPFGAVAMNGYAAYANHAHQNCTNLNVGSFVVHLLGIVAVEALLTIRTWAYWERSKRMLVCLGIFATLCLVAGAISSVYARVSTAVEFGHDPFVDTSCEYQADRRTGMAYVFVFVYELLLLILTAYRRFYMKNKFRSVVLDTLCWDGIKILLCQLLLSVLTIATILGFPISYDESFDCPQVVIHSVLATRILFNLRESDKHAHEESTIVPRARARYTYDAGVHPSASSDAIPLRSI